MAEASNTSWYVNLNLNVRGLAPSATLAINEKCNTLKREGKEVFKLGLGQSPFPVPDSVVETLKVQAFQKDYLSVNGLYELREAISAYNLRSQGIQCDPEDILIGPGSKELLFILQLVFYGDLVIPCPSWVSYSPQAHIIGRMVEWANTSQTNGWRLTAEALDFICRDDPQRPRILILNYPANPTGCTYDEAQLKALAKTARKYNVVLLSDEIYGELHFEGKHQSIAKYYPEGTIVSSGLSKWCGAGGWRLGTFTFPKTLRWLKDAMAIVASETFTATSAPIQYAAITAFNGNKEIDQYLVNSRKVLRGLGKIMTNAAREMQLNLSSPQGAFYIFPDFSAHQENLNRRNILTSAELCKKLLEDTGVAMLPGSDFGLPSQSLRSRVAFVDFDGRKALEVAEKEYTEKEIDEAFFDQYCPNLKKSLDRLGNWLLT